MNKKKFALGKENFILLGISLLIIVLGFALMSGAQTSEESGFNPAIFDTRRIIIAPTITVIGFAMVVVAILFKPKSKKQ